MTDPAAATPREAAAFGPFFAFEIHDPDSAVVHPWRPMGELTSDGGVLAERAESVRGYLAAAGGRERTRIEPRVAASVDHLGLVARLVSPALALTVLLGRPPRLDLAGARWQPVPGGLFPLSLPAGLLRPGEPQDPPAGAARALLDGPVHELVEAAARLGVSRRVLWGNVASAVNGAATALAAAAPSRQVRERARQAAALLLAQPRLEGTHTRQGPDGRFRRRSCCLIYRAAPNSAGALCGDCVLAGPRPRRLPGPPQR